MQWCISGNHKEAEDRGECWLGSCVEEQDRFDLEQIKFMLEGKRNRRGDPLEWVQKQRQNEKWIATMLLLVWEQGQKIKKKNVALLLVGPKAKAKLSMKITLPIPMGSNLVRTKFLNHFVKFKSEPLHLQHPRPKNEQFF